MKILYVITSTSLGGAEKALFELASKTSEIHTVKVVCLKKLGSVAAALQKKGISVLSLNMKGPGLGIVKKLSKEILSFQPDIVHAMLYRAMVFSRLACAGKPVKLITTPHFDLSKKNILLRGMDRLLKEIDCLTVAESFSTANYLVTNQKYKKEKVYLLPNGVDKTIFYPDSSLRNVMRNRYQYTEEMTVFICVARLEPVKDPLTLLKAFRNIYRTQPGARLIYVGEGGEEAVLKNYIEQTGLQEAVLLAGKQENVVAWLNMADVFVLPSIEESLPLALLEGLHVGLPCIVSRVGDMPLWVEHGKNGFVFPKGDVILLSCFLKEMCSRELRKKMGDMSLEISQKNRESFQEYQQLYQNVLLDSFHVKTKKEK